MKWKRERDAFNKERKRRRELEESWEKRGKI